MVIVRQLPGLRVINSGSPSSYTLVTSNFSETEKLSAPASVYHTASAWVFCLHRRSASLLNSHTRTRARLFTRTARVHRRAPTFSCSSSSTHQRAGVSPLRTSKPQLSSRVLWTHVIIYCKYKEVKNNGNSCEFSKDFLHISHLHMSPHKRAKA